MDLTMFSLTNIPAQKVEKEASTFYSRFKELLKDAEFDDLITRFYRSSVEDASPF